MGGDLIEQGVGLLGREAGGNDTDVDPAGVHGGQQVLRWRCPEVATQQLGDALVARPAQEGIGGPVAEALTQRSTTVT